jgi:hypothetical protein
MVGYGELRLLRRGERDILGYIEHEGDAAGVFQPVIFYGTGASLLLGPSERNLGDADFELYVFH